MLPEFEEVEFDGGLAEFISLVSKRFPCAHNYYRGASKVKYDLVPSLGRLSFYRSASQGEKDEMETNFLSSSYQARNSLGPACYNEIAAAIAAQHHGAPTRLLDWSDSPLVALYFATEPKVDFSGQLVTPESDAAVWVKHECPVDYEADGSVLNRSFVLSTSLPQKFRDVEWSHGSSGFQPAILTPRISAQLGSFTACEKPDVDLRNQYSDSITNIWKIVIPASQIPTIQEDLYRLGIRKRSIYPDEDGLNSSLVAEEVLDVKLSDRCSTGE